MCQHSFHVTYPVYLYSCTSFERERTLRPSVTLWSSRLTHGSLGFRIKGDNRERERPRRRRSYSRIRRRLWLSGNTRHCKRRWTEPRVHSWSRRQRRRRRRRRWRRRPPQPLMVHYRRINGAAACALIIHVITIGQAHPEHHGVFMACPSVCPSIGSPVCLLRPG